MIVHTVYVPNRGVAKSAVPELIEIIDRFDTSAPDALMIINGDFNHCTLKRSSIHFYQQINCPTRDVATLDLLYTNVKDAYLSIKLSKLGKADHNLVNVVPRYRPKVQREKPRIITVQQWNNVTIDHLRAELDCSDWDMFVKASADVHELTQTISDYISFCVENTIPTKQVKVFPNNKPWITKRVKEIINKKKGLFKKGDTNALKDVQKQLKRVIAEEKSVYRDKIEGLLTENNMKRVWDGIRLMSGYSNNSKSCHLPTTSTDYANDLNKFFNRFDEHDFSKELHGLQTLLSDVNCNIVVFESEVRRHFINLNPSKRAGPDNVSSKVLKHCAIELSRVFTHIYNLSFKTGQVPHLWKVSRIIPVSKRPVITCMNDLRPIALTAVPMKVCERIFLKHFKLLVAPFLDPLQFAYNVRCSCEDAILVLLQYLYSHLEHQGNTARLMFFDFTSAFNTIQPHILAKKLISMDVFHGFIHWILGYLTDRTQFVSLGRNYRSDIISSNTGAPQGTVLAPFLFTLYTSDCRTQEVMCPLIKFADDTAMTGLIHSDDDRAYLHQLQSFVEYCNTNFLQLNISKTKEMVIDFRRSVLRPPPVFIDGVEVERVSSYKYLGVHLTDSLTWGDQVDALIKKLNSRLYCLRKMAIFKVRTDVMNMFYNATIYGVWRYCLITWGVTKADKERIDSII